MGFMRTQILVFINSLHTLDQKSQVTLSKAFREGRPSLLVTWTPPQSDLNISQYQVQYTEEVGLLLGVVELPS